MKAVITGDINSEGIFFTMDERLKECFERIWQRTERLGNLQRSFQLVVDLADALVIALLLKATIKQHKALDVRMAIGIGTIDYTSNKVTESNGVLSLTQGNV
jgi:hypothetical protein